MTDDELSECVAVAGGRRRQQRPVARVAVQALECLGHVDIPSRV
jgi:hypothetical protein